MYIELIYPVLISEKEFLCIKLIVIHFDIYILLDNYYKL